MLQGIHLGVSHQGSAIEPPDKAGTVSINSNNIEVDIVPEATRDRHGIFVGNCDSLILENNYIKIRRLYEMKNIDVEAIRIYGYLGRMMIVRQNHLVNVTTGIYVRPLKTEGKSLWIVSYNMVPKSAKVVDAPDSVKKEQNYA